jgi:CheY-like chemotaxis protein
MAKILMIDDDRDLVAVTKLVLEAHGHEFYSASNGELGLRRVRETHPDAIVLDVMMDRYTEGFYVSQKLRDPDEESPYAAFRHVPILVLTSIHRTTLHRFGPNENALPVDAFLEKPATPERLLATLEALLVTSAERAATS